MNKKYIIPSAILLLLGFVLIFLPERNNAKELGATDMLLDVIDDARFVSTDDIAHALVTKDPSVQLIDVRSPQEYAAFHLPGAINIPQEKLLEQDSLGYYVNEYLLNQQIKTNVFYSNGTVYASQSWMLTRRMGYQNNYIMKGGLNRWVETIMNPTQPSLSASKDEKELFAFRKAASMFFGGGGAAAAPAGTGDAPTAAPVPTRKKKKMEGGC